MRKADVNLNLQLIQCWEEIQHWISSHATGISEEYQLQSDSGLLTLAIERGKAFLDYKDSRGRFYIQDRHYIEGLKRNTLKTVIRSRELPFTMLSALVIQWEALKERILQDQLKRSYIFQFKV